MIRYSLSPSFSYMLGISNTTMQNELENINWKSSYVVGYLRPMAWELPKHERAEDKPY